MSTKPIAAVVVEGTLTSGYDIPIGNLGDWVDGVREKLASLRKTHYVVLVSSVVRYPWGVSLLLDRLVQDEIPFDEIHMTTSIPESVVRYDNEAKTL